MNTIEIKHRRKLVGPFFAVCLLIMLITAYVLFFTEKYKDNTMEKVWFGAVRKVITTPSLRE